MFIVLKSFAGKNYSGTKGKTINIEDSELAKSLKKAGYIGEVSKQDKKNADKDKEIVELKSTISDLTTQVETLENEKSNLIEQIETLGNEKADLLEQIECLKQTDEDSETPDLNSDNDDNSDGEPNADDEPPVNDDNIEDKSKASNNK